MINKGFEQFFLDKIIPGKGFFERAMITFAAMTMERYNEDSVRSLDWKEHIRLRPGMYIGKLGDGASQDDGIYILIKEIMDNAIDEHVSGYGKQIDVKIEGRMVTVRE